MAKARDARIDILRGLALLTIFVDHIPPDVLNRYTLHNFSFSDAAEVFVFLAGASSMMAYGRAFEQGMATGVRRVASWCLKIYLVQVMLFLFTVSGSALWRWAGHDTPITGRVLDAGWVGIARGLLLEALPTYLDILPLYIVLLALFPAVHAASRWSPWLALGVSGAVWLLANLSLGLNLPNMLSPDGWYFNPFAWQFLFTIGAVSAPLLRQDRQLPPRVVRRLRPACWVLLAFGLLETFDWTYWQLPDLTPLGVGDTDKSLLSPLRLVSILALIGLLFSSPALTRLSGRPFLQPLAACGRHSLEVFATGCLLAYASRILFILFGVGWAVQAGINLVGMGCMVGVALAFDGARLRRGRPERINPHYESNKSLGGA